MLLQIRFYDQDMKWKERTILFFHLLLHFQKKRPRLFIRKTRRTEHVLKLVGICKHLVALFEIRCSSIELERDFFCFTRSTPIDLPRIYDFCRLETEENFGWFVTWFLIVLIHLKLTKALLYQKWRNAHIQSMTSSLLIRFEIDSFLLR